MLHRDRPSQQLAIQVPINRQDLTREGSSPYQSCLCFATKAVLQLDRANPSCLVGEALHKRFCFFLFRLEQYYSQEVIEAFTIFQLLIIVILKSFFINRVKFHPMENIGYQYQTIFWGKATTGSHVKLFTNARVTNSDAYSSQEGNLRTK